MATADMLISTLALAVLLLAGLVAGWRATGAAARELFGNPGWGGDSWIAENAVPAAVLWPVLIIGVFAAVSVRRYREMSR